MREAAGYIDGLHDLCRHMRTQSKQDLGNLTMAEIGVFRGESASVFSQYFKRVYCVDPYWPGYDPADYASNADILRKAEKDFDLLRKEKTNLLPVRRFSKEAADLFSDEELFCVYIDACHKYEAVKGDILLWMQKVAPNGFVTGHDYILPGVSKAVNEILGKPEKVCKDTSWLISKQEIMRRNSNGT